MTQLKRMTPAELKELLDAGQAPVVVDVLPPEHHAAGRIPGAVNHCVYQVVFLDELAQAVPDKGRPLVLYSASRRCQGARDAADKLLDAGYQDVAICPDGLEGWRQAGFPLEGDGPEPLAHTDLGQGDFSLAVDPSASRVEWTGRSRSICHLGAVPLTHGALRFSGGKLVYGFFELDMTGLSNENLTDPALAAMLLAHLASRDFFLAEVFPTARFETTRVEALQARGGVPNFALEGLLTLRGVAREVCPSRPWSNAWRTAAWPPRPTSTSTAPSGAPTTARAGSSSAWACTWCTMP